MRCLRVSYKVCDLQALLPESLQIPLCYKPFELPCSRGGFADIWKGEYLGQMVAAKALRVSETDDFNTIRRVGSPLLVLFIKELTASITELLQGGHDMEES